ncbi:YheC/YheD family protein [Metabacillus fastidiosus]|uniref:YheC/YheD family endospore coat-associated protein n=1 Tax=Metabacillus fastidiosus TaxID=1458 RepID=UPI003D28FB21
MGKTYTIQFINKSTKTIILPEAMRNKGKIEKIAFGTLFSACQTEYKKDLENRILISKEIVNKIKIRDGINIHLVIHDGTVHLGPLIGIFTAGFTKSSLRPTGGRSLFFSKYLSIQQSLGICAFIFGAHHINWEEGTIDGFIYTKEGFKQVTLPFPDVIYDRLPNRKVEKLQKIKKAKNRLRKSYSIPWYNPGFFNKWDIHKLIINDLSVSSYLPETYINPTISKMEEMLKKYKSIFLKPANGSLGLGVFQLMYSKEENQYFSRYRDKKSRNRLKKFPSLEHFLKHAFQDRTLSDYLAQQGIKLIRFDKNQLDFRIHTNKDEFGNWKVTALAAKVAGKGSVTTHLNNGGVVKTLEEIYTNEQERNHIMHLLTEAAIKLSVSIDKHVNGFIGEIGFDLGLDQDGKIWMFEANSKPGRSIFSYPKLKKADLYSRKLALLYGRFLAEKAIKEPGRLHE